jgi:hypothetical protein
MRFGRNSFVNQTSAFHDSSEKAKPQVQEMSKRTKQKLSKTKTDSSLAT